MTAVRRLDMSVGSDRLHLPDLQTGSVRGGGGMSIYTQFIVEIYTYMYIPLSNTLMYTCTTTKIGG